MQRFVFVSGQLHQSEAIFIEPVAYNNRDISQGRLMSVAGGGSFQVSYTYDPINKIELKVDPIRHAAFINAAKLAAGDDSGPLSLFTQEGYPLQAVIQYVKDGQNDQPTIIGVQPDDGSW